MAWAGSFVTTDSHNQLAKRLESEFEQARLPMRTLFFRFRSWLGKVGPKLDAAIKKNKSAQAHAFMLKEAAQQSRYQMSDELEALASELSLSGGNAFEKLQGTVTRGRLLKQACKLFEHLLLVAVDRSLLLVSASASPFEGVSYGLDLGTRQDRESRHGTNRTDCCRDLGRCPPGLGR